MPTYTVTAPDGKEYDIDAPEGATEQQVLEYAKSQIGAPRQQSVGEDLTRQAGLGVRSVVTGLTGIPTMIGDAANAAVNLGIAGINRAAGTNIRQLPMLGETIQRGMTQAGLPEPQTIPEKVASIGGAALSGAGGATTLARQARNFPILNMILSEFGRGPGLQTVGAASGALAVEGVKQAGTDNPAALAGAAILGSIAPGMGASGTQRAAGAIGQLAAPFRSVDETGILPGISREVIAGKVLNRLATTPSITPQVMESAGQLVPGSAPTIAQVSRDPGLITAESGIRNALDTGAATSGRIAQRQSQQNVARQAELERMILPSEPVPEGGVPRRGTLEYAEAKRERTITQNRNAAFANAGRADIAPVMSSIDEVLARPTGAKAAVQQAMTFARQRLGQENVDVANPETLYAIRQDINDYRLGRYVGADQGAARLAGSELRSVIATMDNAIDTAAPGYRRYMDLYAKRSIPLDQQAALRQLREKGQVAGSDPLSGERILTIGKYGTAVRNAIASGALARTVGGAKLSDRQLATIQNVVADLDRSAAGQAATMKVPGSDTFKNFSVASVIGQIVGDKQLDTPAARGLQTIAKPLAWMYTLPDEAIGQLLVEATLDPRLAARLMRQASAYEIQSIATELAERAARQSIGGAAYAPNQ